ASCDSYALSLHDALPILLGTDIPLRPGEAGSLVTALTVAVMALASFLLVRRNRFQVAIRLMLAVVSLQLLWAYSTNGLSAHVFRSEEHTSELQSRENLVC